VQHGERRDPPAPDELERFHDSLQRCTEGGDFYEAFYEGLLASDPRVPALFERTDMARQRRMLHHSLVLVMNLHLRDPEIDRRMAEIADRHVEIGIDDDLYDVWLETLLATVAASDRRFDARVEAAWRAVLRRGVAFMHARRHGHTG